MAKKPRAKKGKGVEPDTPSGPISTAWTIEQIMARDACVEGDIADPTRPYAQWAGLHQLEDLRIRFEGGDVHALMIAIRVCANHDLRLPAWVAKAYIGRFDDVNRYRAKSWDDVFGAPLPKGQQLHAAREALTRPLQIGMVVRRLLQASIDDTGKKRPIDAALFEEVGRALGISGSTAARHYYGKKKNL